MSVLASVVLGGSSQAEPAATQALAYILNSSPDIARAFVATLNGGGIKLEPGAIRAEFGHDEGIPDLTILDDEGRVRVLIENKFWAGLTEAQPVGYLQVLPDQPPSTLAFVVPEQRMSTVWTELEDRCRRAGLNLGEPSVEPRKILARAGSKTMMLTSWKHVLETLVDAAHSGGHDAARDDILQLKGLTDRMDREAFLPLRPEEVTCQETARRLVNYSDLVEGITQKLKDRGVADTKKLLPTHTYHTTGRYLRVHGKFGLWLGIELDVWRDRGITPLWCLIGNREIYGVTGHLQTIFSLFENAKLDEKTQNLYIPIPLKTGVERDRVIEEAVAEMTRIADRLLQRFPDS